jgi:chromosome segregation ATPase
MNTNKNVCLDSKREELSHTLETDRIKELEEVVRTMSEKMSYMQKINDHYDKLLINAEKEHIRNHKILKKIQKENEELRCHISNLTIELISKENDYDNLSKELREEKHILSFIEEQTTEMRNMINGGNNKKCKLTIEDLID